MAGTVALLMAAGVVTADGADASAAHTVTVDSHFDDPGFLTGVRNVSCSPLGGVCLVTYRGHSAVTGTLSGWTDYTAWLWMHADGSTTFTTHETFTGAVDGCGLGSFDFVISDGTVTGPDPATQTFTVHGTWTVVDGSGTGALAGVSGSGAEDGVSSADTSTSGTLTGALTCAKH